MMEEQKPATGLPTTPATTEQPGQTTQPAPSQTPPAEANTPVTGAGAPASPAWLKELDTADPEQLRRHPRIAGIVGTMFDQWRQRHEAEVRVSARARVTAEQDEELFRLLDENAQVLQERYPKAHQRLEALRQAKSEEELGRRIGESRQQFAERIGQAYRALPEWAELGPGDFEALASEVANKPEDEAVGAFAVKAAELVAEKRAIRRSTEWQAKELQKARAAIRQEEAAKLLGTSEAPDTRRGTGAPAAVNVKAMTDAQFEEYWNKHVK